jgi:hypothetical protein
MDVETFDRFCDALAGRGGYKLDQYLNIILWLPLLVVLVGEHLALKHVYGKRSSLEKLFVDRSDSTKIDVLFWFIYYLFPRWLLDVGKLVTVPGMILIE